MMINLLHQDGNINSSIDLLLFVQNIDHSTSFQNDECQHSTTQTTIGPIKNLLLCFAVVECLFIAYRSF
jgi:hypothetical protein